jgi:hypothetical protein
MRVEVTVAGMKNFLSVFCLTYWEGNCNHCYCICCCVLASRDVNRAC